MDLRAKITEALLAREVPEELQSRLAPGELRAQKAEAVMGVVEGEITHWRTEAADAKRIMDRRGELVARMKELEAEHGGQKCVRRAEIYDQVCGQMHEEAETAKARVRELEDENQRMRDDLEAATRFEIGAAEVYRTRFGVWAVCVDRERLEKTKTRDAALSRARDIAKEDTK